ncbi:MAG: MerR family transcriptional regulator [Lachnospiraceae bacterium]|nr:MerR family transcriptional regulator [Lachnospiraceae bacterium]
MDKYKAIPQGYMTVGEIAGKMDVTVRTLQHYDREGLLSPSAMSEGGRRLYTDKDIVKLHQILSLKHLGFSLDDIKNRLIPLDTPAEIADVLTEQAAAVRQKIESLSESLRELEVLREEVLQMQSVDFKKYADIIVNLQMKNDFYWLIKHFDDQTLDHIRSHFDKDSGMAFMNTFMQLQNEAIRLQNAGVPADSDQGQDFANAYWNMITEFTGGDMSMLPRLMELGKFQNTDCKWKEIQDTANGYIEQALGVYFSRLGVDPFQGERKEETE